MALPKTQQQREYQNFRDNGDETTSRYVYTVNGNSSGLLSGVVYDFVSVSYPDALTEVYSFKNGGASGTLSATVTIIYTDATKDNISTASKS